MLSNQESLLLLRVRAHLAGTKILQKDEVNEVLTALDTAILTAATQAAKRTEPRGTPKPGRPPVTFIVDMDPGWRASVQGMAAAAALVDSTMREHGLRGVPSQSTLSVALARNGYWMRLIETDNGTCILTVRRDTATDSPPA